MMPDKDSPKSSADKLARSFTPPFKYRIGQAIAWVFRFKVVSIANSLFSKAQSPTYITRNLFGFQFVCDITRSITHQALFLNGERSIEERYLVSSLVDESAHAVDIGANIGYYLLMLEKEVGQNGKVTLIEPSIENLPELKLNIELNHFTNVDLHEVAIGMENGAIGLKTGVNSGIVESDQGAYQVRLKTLDSIVEEKVDFLKIDVEGYEGQVLGGAEALIERDHPTIFLEMHPHMLERFGFTTRGIIQKLESKYEDMVFYELHRPENKNVLKKIFSRYSKTDPMQVILDAGSFVDKCDSGLINRPFWVVCR